MVRPGRESFKRFISTIMDLLPPYIEKYPPSDQLLLREFLSVLRHYDEADYQRKKLSQRFREYIDRHFNTDQYLQTAFLWFTDTYFRNAYRLLTVSKFHANSYYEYLVKHLRGSSNIPGVFKLIQNKVSITNLAWEQLQYESVKLIVPLTIDQLQIISTVYSAVMEEGVHALDSRKLRALIGNQVGSPRNLNDELIRFFNLIDGQWVYRFFTPAFGLDMVIMQIQLDGSVSLEEIIDFQNPANTVISRSDVYLVRNLPNTYIGILSVPTQDFEQLKGYLQECEHQGRLILKSLEKIETRRFSSSLAHYRTNTGWFEPSPSRMRRLAQLLRTQNPRENQGQYSSLFIPPQFNSHWHFSDHPLPREIINLFCNISLHTYTYQNLPLTNQDLFSLTQADVGLLKQLFYNRVLQVRFVPQRLLDEFSLDLYCIILPKIPVYQLIHFLNLIPNSDVYYTEESIYVWGRFTSKLIQWIENNLQWTVLQIIRKNIPLNFEFNQFDPGELQWITPQFLRE
ncbi:MAG: hypothetical protein ACFFC6_00395 [Promethearchaeota archaeon]